MVRPVVLRRVAVLLAFAAATGACARRPDLEAERVAILAADSAWRASVATNNIDSVLSFWTEDARVIGPGQLLIGHEAIRKMLVESSAIPGFSVSWRTTDVVVAPSGDVAWSFGPNMFTVPGQGGRIDTLRNTATVVWRKGADGRWRSAVDTWTPQ